MRAGRGAKRRERRALAPGLVIDSSKISPAIESGTWRLPPLRHRVRRRETSTAGTFVHSRLIWSC